MKLRLEGGLSLRVIQVTGPGPGPGMSLALTRHPSLLARAIVKLEQFCIQNIEKDIAVI